MDVRADDLMKKRFLDATDSFINKVKVDPNVIAVIVCGSLAYDVVWEKSDIDMTVIVRDQTLSNNSYCITEDDILINVSLLTRSDFKRGFEKIIGGTFMHSYYNKGKMLYTTDESLEEYFEEMKSLGSDDIAYYVFYTACELVHTYEKTMKWLKVKKDKLYAQYYLLNAAKYIANIEVCLSGEPPTRESIQKARLLRPDIIELFYDEVMKKHLSFDEIERRLQSIDDYLKEHIDIIKKPVIDYMSDGEIKTITLLTKHFHSHGHYIVGILDYLSENGVIEKVSHTIRLTPKSRPAVEEIGYIYLN